jgi:hypothetical protein
VNLPESQVFINESKKNIPFDPENIYIDSIEVNSRPILYIAASKQVVDQYVNVMKTMGIVLVILDIQPASLGRALLSGKYNPESKEAVAILYFNSRAASLSFFNDKNALSMSVAIQTEGNMLNIKEIEDAISYYQNKSGKTMREIVVVASSNVLPKVREYLSQNLTNTLVTANPLENIKNAQILSKEIDQALLSSVIGLALRANEDLSLGINLLPESINIEKRGRYLRVLVVQISEILHDIRRSMLFGVSFLIAGLILIGFVIYFYVLKSPEKPTQYNTPNTETELKIIIPQETIILDATSTEYRGFRELLEEKEE